MKKWFFLLVLGILSGSCDKELKSGDTDAFFDKIAILENVTNNHILPQFEAFNQDTKALVEAKNTFVASKTEESLIKLREAYLKAYKTYQPVSTYDIGLAEEQFFYQNLNSHPLKLEGLSAFILNQENENLGSILTQNRQGFPAVDYLLNGLASNDADILAFYTQENAANYTEFLSEIINKIDSLTSLLNEDWKANFQNTFTSEGAFLEVFVNKYIQYFEKRLRSTKIDFPAGKFDGTPSPETIESLFKPEESKGLLLIALENARLIYTGINEEVSSISKTLIELGEEGLDAQIKLKFLEAQNLIEKLDDNLKLQVETDNTKMLEARDALQEVVRLLKIDLTSKLNIGITFQDNDGD